VEEAEPGAAFGFDEELFEEPPTPPGPALPGVEVTPVLDGVDAVAPDEAGELVAPLVALAW